MLNFLNLKKEIGNVSTTVHNLRKNLENAKRRREDLETLAVSREDYIAKLHGWVDFQAQQYPVDLKRCLAGTPNKPFADLTQCTLNIIEASGDGGRRGIIQSTALCYLFGDLIKARLADAVMAMDWPKETGPPAADRREEMERLDRQIAEIENQVAQLLAEADAAGIVIR